MNRHVYIDLLHDAIKKHGLNPCMHIKREGHYRSWTFNDFHHDLNCLASLLKRQGLKKGSNAIVIGENTPEWVIAFHAIILSGACTVPIDPNITASEIESILTVTEPEIVFCTPVFLNLFRTCKEKYSFPKRIVILDDKVEEKEPRFDQYIISGNEDYEAFSNKFEPDDPMTIIFTSGTTGRAKGAVLCQKNYTAVKNHAVAIMGLNSEDTVCAVLPLHHVFGFAACIAGPIAAGMDVVFVPYIKGPLILEALKDKGVTMLPAVPKMVALFYDSIMHNVKKKGPFVTAMFSGMKIASSTAGKALGDQFRRNLFSSVHKGFGGKLKVIISGGAALGKKYWHGFNLLGFKIVEGYGLTETFGPITLCPFNDARPGSVGPALSENEIKIFEPNESGIGEVLLRGICVFKGYYKKDDLTREVIDQDGWFHTGDLGKLDTDGFLYLSGRKKDMIVLDTGKNVYPDELEDYYGTSPHIEEIGIFGVKQNETEIVAAAIVPSKEIRKSYSLQQATSLIYEELLRLGKSLPVYRRISDFVTVYTPLPRTTTRKLKKPELLKLYNSIKRKSENRPISEEQLSVLEMAMMETEEYLGIVNSISFTYPRIDINIINPRSHLEIDLGMDSLRKIELLTHLEQRFSISVPEEIFEKMETVSDLVSLIRERRAGGAFSVEKIMGLKERILSDSIEPVRFPEKSNLMAKTAAPLVKIAGRLTSPVKYDGIGNLSSSRTPMIFASNHNHILDIFWILNSLPEQIRRNTFYIGDCETQRYPALPYALHRRHMLKLERPGDPIHVLKTSLSVVRRDRNLIIFPEGQLNRTSSIGRFKSGVGLIIKETGATIVPVRTSPVKVNSQEKSGTAWNIRFGKPFTFAELVAAGRLTSESSAEEIAEEIRTVISSL